MPAQSLFEIFNNKAFIIPDYQRGYSWDSPEKDGKKYERGPVYDFWKDLINAKDNNRNHFTGVLTLDANIDKDYINNANAGLSQLVNEGNYTPLYIVDGQQRLTTAIILIKSILNKINDDRYVIQLGLNCGAARSRYICIRDEVKEQNIYLFSYTNDNLNSFIKENIFENNNSKKPESVYEKNLLKAKEFFSRKLSDMHNDDVKKIFNTLTNKFKFIENNEIAEDFDIFVSFETMNNRGKELSTLELLKNRLMYIDHNHFDGKLRQEITKVWASIYNELGRNLDSMLNDDDFLSDHLIMYYTYSKGMPFKDELLRKHMIFVDKEGDKDGIKESDDIASYIESLKTAVVVWTYLQYPEFFDGDIEIKVWLYKMELLEYKSFLPLTMAVFIKYQKGDIEHGKIIEYFKKISRYNFLVFGIARRRSDAGDSVFKKLAYDFFNGRASFDEVLEKIDEYQGRYWKNKEEISRYIEDVEELFRTGKGFYDWNETPYFLMEYEYYLHRKSGNFTHGNFIDSIKFSSHYKRTTNIEHIYPQSSNDNENDNTMCHSLGNLVLTTSNSTLSNKEFADKCAIYENGLYAEKEIAKSKKWDREEIYDRGKKMIEFMKDTWEIDFNDENIKKLALPDDLRSSLQ